MSGGLPLLADELASRLSQALACGLPGRTAQRTMAPQMAYGRHHGPVPPDARRAAVLALLMPDEHGWAIPAIVRPQAMKTHAGQVSLPGGMVEPGESAEEAAYREFSEELGCDCNQCRTIGRLSPVYVFISNFEVTTILAVSPTILTLSPNADEVEDVVLVPSTALLELANRGDHLIQRERLIFRVPHFAVGGRQIWGATSLILAELAALLRDM